MGTGATPSLGSGGLLAQLVADSTAARTRMETLTRQTSSGQVAQSYGGLGTLARVSLDLRPQMAQATAWQGNIDAAGTRLEVTQSVLTQLGDLADGFATDSLGVAMSTTEGMNALAAQAGVALDQVTELLNTRVGDAYLFSGTDTANPPLDDTALATFIATVQAPVGNLVANGAAATATTVATAAAAGSIVSATIGTSPVTAETGPGRTVPQGVVAGRNLAQPAARSYVNDLVAGLAVLAGLKGLNPDQSTMSKFGAAMSGLLRGAATAITTDQSVLGEVQSELTTRKTALSDTVTTLTKQVSGVEEVDMAAAATALAQVQTQLEASYKLIAGMRDLSLASYL